MFLSSVSFSMNHLVKIGKYFLWVVFSLIVFVLFIGLVKTKGNLVSYVNFLNTSNWSVFHLGQPTTWTAPFWPKTALSGSIADILTGDIETEMSGLDVYDPAFEEDFNALDHSSLSGNTDEYGFTSETSSGALSDSATTSGMTAKSELYNIIKKSVK